MSATKDRSRGREKPPAVVAELGRPETPDETAARKAESSRLYRRRKTINNLVYSLIVCAVGMFAIFALVPRSDTPLQKPVDYASAAAGAQAGFAQHLTVPVLPEGWSSNEAELRTGSDGVTEWYVGFLHADASGQASEFVGVSQGLDANPTWVAAHLKQRPATGETVIDGTTWQEYDYLSLPAADTGNTAYAIVLERDGSTYVVYGSHSAESVHEVARAVMADFRS